MAQDENIAKMSEAKDVTPNDLSTQADDIARLTRERDEWKRRYHLDGVCEIGAVNINVASYSDHWEQRATATEATLQEVRKALRSIADTTWDYSAAEACLTMIKDDARSALSLIPAPRDDKDVG